MLAELRRKNPRLFKADKLTMSVAELERIMAWAFDQGKKTRSGPNCCAFSTRQKICLTLFRIKKLSRLSEC